MKLNIGNYQSVDFTTNEYEAIEMCYHVCIDFLRGWTGITNNAGTLLKHIERLLK